MTIKAYSKIILMPALLAIMLALGADATALESGSSQSLRAVRVRNPRDQPIHAQNNNFIAKTWLELQPPAKAKKIEKTCDNECKEQYKVMYEKNPKTYEKKAPDCIKGCIKLAQKCESGPQGTVTQKAPNGLLCCSLIDIRRGAQCQ